MTFLMCIMYFDQSQPLYCCFLSPSFPSSTSLVVWLLLPLSCSPARLLYGDFLVIEIF
jgi:hypothetical protein